jgi:glutamate transport system permease protein
VNVLIDKFDVFAGGFWLTFQICILAAIGALILGAVVAVLRISPVPPLRAVGTAYVNVFRNMPLTVVMFFSVFALPALGSNADFLRVPGLDVIFTRLGTDLPYFRFCLIALVFYTAAFVCEALRSGVNAARTCGTSCFRSLGRPRWCRSVR